MSDYIMKTDQHLFTVNSVKSLDQNDTENYLQKNTNVSPFLINNNSENSKKFQQNQGTSSQNINQPQFSLNTQGHNKRSNLFNNISVKSKLDLNNQSISFYDQSFINLDNTQNQLNIENQDHKLQITPRNNITNEQAGQQISNYLDNFRQQDDSDSQKKSALQQLHYPSEQSIQKNVVINPLLQYHSDQIQQNKSINLQQIQFCSNQINQSQITASNLESRNNLAIGTSSPQKSHSNTHWSKKTKSRGLSFYQQSKMSASQKRRDSRITLRNGLTVLAIEQISPQIRRKNKSVCENRTNLISRIVNVQKFVQRLKFHARSLIFRRMQQKHFDIINDLSYFYQEKKNQKQDKQINEKQPHYQSAIVLNQIVNEQNVKNQSNTIIQQICDYCDKKFHFKTIKPDSQLYIMFQILLLFLILCLFVIIPIDIVFLTEINYNTPLIYFISLVFFIIEILLQFITGYYQDGFLVYDKQLIVKQYCKRKLIIDIISIIPLLLEKTPDIQKLFKMLFYLRVPQLMKIIKQLDEFYNIQHRYFIIAELLKLTTFILLMTNIMGCGFNFVAKIEIKRDNPNNWIDQKEYRNSEWEERYLLGLYFAIITMATVGYGDLSPYSMLEIGYVAVITLLSTAIFAYSINTIQAIFHDVRIKNAKYRNIKSDMTNYMRARNISKGLQIKIIKYLEYINNQENQSHDQAKVILQNQVSQNLRQDLKNEYYGSYLQNNNLFKQQFTSAFLNHLSQNMQEMTLYPGEILYKENQDEKRIFIIQKGQVIIKRKNKEIAKLFKGDLFNFESFFYGNNMTQKSQISVHSGNQIVQLIYINSIDFHKNMAQYPIDYEKFCYLRDDMKFNERSFNFPCFQCSQYTHEIQNCPLTSYIPNTQLLILKNNYQIDQNREFKLRNCNKKCSLSNKKIIQEDLKYLRFSLIQDMDQEITGFQGIEFQQILEDYPEDEQFFSAMPSIKVSKLSKEEIENSEQFLLDQHFEEEIMVVDIDFSEDDKFHEYIFQEQLKFNKISDRENQKYSFQNKKNHNNNQNLNYNYNNNHQNMTNSNNINNMSNANNNHNHSYNQNNNNSVTNQNSVNNTRKHSRITTESSEDLHSNLHNNYQNNEDLQSKQKQSKQYKRAQFKKYRSKTIIKRRPSDKDKDKDKIVSHKFNIDDQNKNNQQQNTSLLDVQPPQQSSCHNLVQSYRKNSYQHSQFAPQPSEQSKPRALSFQQQSTFSIKQDIQNPSDIDYKIQVQNSNQNIQVPILSTNVNSNLFYCNQSLINFDQAKKYIYYFPNFNFNNILEKFNRQQLKKNKTMSPLRQTQKKTTYKKPRQTTKEMLTLLKANQD